MPFIHVKKLKINIMLEIEDFTFLYFYSERIKELSKKINRLSFHLGKCKQKKDIVKLFSMISAYSLEINMLIEKINYTIHFIKE